MWVRIRNLLSHSRLRSGNSDRNSSIFNRLDQATKFILLITPHSSLICLYCVSRTMSDYEDMDDALDYEFDGASGADDDVEGPGDALEGDDDEDDEAAEVDLGSQDTDEADDDDDDDDADQNDGEVSLELSVSFLLLFLTHTMDRFYLQGGDDDDEDDVGDGEGDDVSLTRYTLLQSFLSSSNDIINHE